MKQKSVKSGLWIKESNKLKLIDFRDITHITFREGASELHIVGKPSKRIPMPLDRFERKVPPDAFFRIHRNYIINKNHVDDYHSDNGLSVVLDGQEFPVSRRRKKEFDQFMDGAKGTVLD